MATRNFSLTLNNGWQIPAVGFGTWLSKPGEVGRAVKWALAAGYRHLDCAYIYQNQTEIGTALTEYFAQNELKRPQVFITSKIWNTYHSKKSVAAHVDEILSQLQIDYLDLCLIHWPHGFKEGDGLFPKKEGTEQMEFSDVDYLETWHGMEACARAGKIRSLGLSNFNSEQILRVIDNSSIKPVINQVECHPYFNQHKLKHFCAEQEMFLTAYSPLSNPGSIFRKPDTPNVLDEPVVKEIAAKHNKSPAQVLIRWASQRGTCVIPKSVTKSRIEENFDIWDFFLHSSEMEQIDNLDRGRDGRLVWLERDKEHPYWPFAIEF